MIILPTPGYYGLDNRYRLIIKPDNAVYIPKRSQKIKAKRSSKK